MKTRLRELRKARKLTQQQMADAISEKVATYRTWERGTTNFNVEQLCACATVLNCSTDLILGREIKTDFDDPREAELHRVWGQLDNNGQTHVLDDAVAQAALQNSSQEGIPPNTETDINYGRSA